MYYPSDRKSLAAKMQAPFVLAEIRALRSSIFKSSPEVQRALAIATKVEQSFDLHRGDLFIPVADSFCAILEPFAMTVLTGTLRRVGYEIFPQYMQILGVPAASVKEALNLKTGVDVVSFICDAWTKCVIGPDAGMMVPEITGNTVSVTDTTFLPCQLQMGVYLGAGKLTGLFRESALVERRCRAKGDTVCVYDFVT